MQSLTNNNYGSAIPVILFVLTIFSLGALYHFLFIEIALPTLSYLIPTSDAKDFIIMGIYAIPAIILLIGVAWLIKTGIKREGVYMP